MLPDTAASLFFQLFHISKIEWVVNFFFEVRISHKRQDVLIATGFLFYFNPTSFNIHHKSSDWRVLKNHFLNRGFQNKVYVFNKVITDGFDKFWQIIECTHTQPKIQ